MTVRSFKLGILGGPSVGKYSLSPVMHQAAFAFLKSRGRQVEGIYQPHAVKPEDLPRWLQEMAPRLDGFNVTMPYKETVFAWVKTKGRLGRPDLDGEIGAVNTVVMEEGCPIGYNTDGEGFLRALTDPPRSMEPKGWRCLLLGAGGSAQAIAFYLASAGAGRITLWNRHVDRAGRLAERIRRCFSGRCDVKTLANLETASLEETDLLVNATPVGMEGLPELLVRVERLPKKAVVYDIVYSPPRTPLLLAAEKQGNPTVNGLEMLAQQGAAAFHLWVGNETPVLGAVRESLGLAA